MLYVLLNLKNWIFRIISTFLFIIFIDKEVQVKQYLYYHITHKKYKIIHTFYISTNDVYIIYL